MWPQLIVSRINQSASHASSEDERKFSCENSTLDCSSSSWDLLL